MNYSEMSDIEINKLVAEASGIQIFQLIDSPAYGVIVGYEGQGEPVSYDPCNSPADAWPLLSSLWWALLRADEYGVTTWARGGRADDGSDRLRDAMIVYLMMNEAKS